jgi:FMN phosphatase YigB (HAD superfamily)
VAAVSALAVLDFSGTLSIAAVGFAAPERIAAELRRSGLWALGLDSPELFWERLVNPTWQEGSTTTSGYTAVIGDAVSALLAARGDRTPRDVIDRCVRAFAGRYLAASTVAPQWRGFLQRLTRRDGVGIVVATDHYAEATGHITAELAALGLDGAAVGQVRDPSRQIAVANSADLGCHKSSEPYWRAVAAALGVRAPSRVVLIDDFGANEAHGDAYAKPARVRQRRSDTCAVLSSAFGVVPDVFAFEPTSGATAVDVQARVDDAERFTMSLLSMSS